MVSAQVVLIAAGLALIVVAIFGSGDFVKIVIPHLPIWARISLGALGAVAFTLAFVPGLLNNSSNSAAPRPIKSLASTSSSAQDQPSASVTYPADGTRVGRVRGFVTGGAATSLGSYTVWILDHPANAYYVDEEANVANGEWAAADRSIGSPSDHLPYSLTVVAVLADPDCAQYLRQLANTGDVRIKQMPPGCKEFGEVTVEVAHS